MRSYYDILGVTPEAEDIVIQGAYRALMKRYHPDVASGDPEARVKEITEAYRTLKDPESRARYDRDLEYRARRRTEDSAGTATPPSSPAAESGVTSEYDAKPANLISNLFLALAAIVFIGAVGSLGSNSGAARAPGASPSTSEVASIAEEAPQAAITPEPKAEAEPEPVEEAPERLAPDLGKLGPDDQPSFDCDRADTSVLALICSEPELAEADRRLASAYQLALERSDRPSDIRGRQRAWLRARAEAEAEVPGLLQLYEVRIRELTEVPVQEPIY